MFSVQYAYLCRQSVIAFPLSTVLLVPHKYECTMYLWPVNSRQSSMLFFIAVLTHFLFNRVVQFSWVCKLKMFLLISTLIYDGLIECSKLFQFYFIFWDLSYAQGCVSFGKSPCPCSCDRNVKNWKVILVEFSFDYNEVCFPSFFFYEFLIEVCFIRY